MVRVLESAALALLLALPAAGPTVAATSAIPPEVAAAPGAERAAAARKEGTVVLWGRCYEGEWAPPYGPFAEAISEYSRSAGPRELRQDLGAGAGPIARVVPELRDSLPDIPEPASLQPDEERCHE